MYFRNTCKTQVFGLKGVTPRIKYTPKNNKVKKSHQNYYLLWDSKQKIFVFRRQGLNAK